MAIAASAPTADNPLSSDLPDIVATQGSFLAPPISTPTFASRYNANFAEALDRALRLLTEKSIVRKCIYGDKGDESRIGHTPLTLRDEFQAERDQELRDLIVTMTPATPSTSQMPHSRLPSLSPATTSESEPTLATPADGRSPATTRKQRRGQDYEESLNEPGPAKICRVAPTRSLRRSPRLSPNMLINPPPEPVEPTQPLPLRTPAKTSTKRGGGSGGTRKSAKGKRRRR